MALAYVAALTGDPCSTVTLQLKREAGDDDLRLAIHHYSFDEDRLWEHIVWENTHGVGVWVMVNKGDLKGRRASNVQKARAVFIDDDNGQLPPGAPQLAKCPPSFSVQSKRGHHHYWLLVDGEALDRFSWAQSVLASHFGTDPAVKDLCRVMRLPGTLHVKDRSAPFLVTFVAGSNQRYRIDDVVAAYPAAESEAPSQRAAGAKRALRSQTPHKEAAALLGIVRRHRVLRWAAACPADVSRETWRGIATNLVCAASGHAALLDAAFVAFDTISAADGARYRPGETRRTWDGAVDSAMSAGPMTFRHMIAHGLPEALATPGATSIIHAARIAFAARSRR
jgi:hypothetical protein